MEAARAWAFIDAFLEKTHTDNRLSAYHCSLYLVLLHEADNEKIICLQTAIVMQQAKMSSRVTYNRCMKELHDYGYIIYAPSFTPGKSMAVII